MTDVDSAESAATVGISLLTLVPGEIGGSETYVHGLLRALGRVGAHEYKVLLPPAAPTAVRVRHATARSPPQRADAADGEEQRGPA